MNNHTLLEKKSCLNNQEAHKKAPQKTYKSSKDPDLLGGLKWFCQEQLNVRLRGGSRTLLESFI